MIVSQTQGEDMIERTWCLHDVIAQRQPPLMDPASAACFQTGQQAAACPSEHNIVLLRCKELSSCGSFRRTAFLRGISQVADQMQPLQLVQIINSLSEDGLFGLQLLRDLLPAPEQAAAVLQQAACSQDVCTALLVSGSWAAVAQGSCSQTPAACRPEPEALHSLLQLLHSMLMYTFDSTATVEAGSMHAAAVDGSLRDNELQQYVTNVLQALQVAATQHKVLAVCLLQAGASCGILGDSAAVASWASKQLHLQLQITVQQPTATAAASNSHAATPPGSAKTLSVSSWPALALQPLCWTLFVPSILQCMPLHVVLGQLQESLSTAAGGVSGLAQMCDAVAAAEACGCGTAVSDMMSQSLSASLAAGDTHGTLAILLLAGCLLDHGVWGKAQHLSMLQQAAAACQEGHAGTAWPVLLKAFNLLLPTADIAALQVQVDFLQHLQPQLGPVLQAEVSNAAAILKDVLTQQQQLLKQEQQNKQGGKAIDRRAMDGYNHYLDQYMQSPQGPDGKRLTHVQIARWKLMGAAPAFCEAFIQQPPEALDRARPCLAYIQELQAAKLCKPGQDEAFKAACMVFGLDLSAQPSRAWPPAQQQPADPRMALKGLLDRLPVVVSAGSRPGFTTLLSRLIDNINSMLQPMPAQQPQPHQQHQQQRPLAQRQRTSDFLGADPSRPSTSSNDVLDALLSAYAAASSRSGNPIRQDTSRDWRVEFLGMMQGLSVLHMDLLQRLMGSLTGKVWPADVAPQQALWHGSLSAWLSASKLQQLPVLAPSSEPAISTAPVAAPLFSWHCSSTSTAGTGTHASASTSVIRGCQLVQLLVSCTSLASAHARCCAASFWAGYVGCVKTNMSQWCAGPQGPFSSSATANISPGVLTAVTQPPLQDAGANAGLQSQQQLLAYVPPQLVLLLRQLVTELTSDVQQAAAAAGNEGASDLPDNAGIVSYAVAASALQVCTRALKVQAVKWVAQLYGV